MEAPAPDASMLYAGTFNKGGIVWMLENRTPYAVERNWVRDKSGKHQWIVAVKATFCIDPIGVLQMAEVQRAPVLAPEYFGEAGKSSLRFDCDLGLTKPTTDVTLNAHAYAPSGRPTEVVLVALSVAGVRKELLVYGDRVHQSFGGVHTLSRPAPFLARPIRYEMAYGGSDLRALDVRRAVFDQRNPIGRGALPPAKQKDQVGCAIEYPIGPPDKRGPAGYGAIDSWWSPRANYAGTYDEAWEKQRKPFLPTDYDSRFTLCSPADQRPHSYLVGGEQVALTNMSKEGRMFFTLPKIKFRFETHFGRRMEEHHGNLVSVIVEPDDYTLLMVWQSALVVAPKDCDYLDKTVVIEHKGD